MISYNNKVIDFGQFPNHEINIKKHIFEDELVNVVTLKYEDDSDLFRLFLVKQHLDAVHIDAVLRITYVPYSRMDRDSDTYAFTLKSVAKFINDMDWYSVVIYEPHSDVTPALLNNVKVVNVTEQLINSIGVESYQVYYPDAGAQKRYSGIHGIESAGDWIEDNALFGLKHRNFATGKIESLQVIGEQVLDTVVILDDLCSKGGTFVMAAEKLREMGFKTIILVVAHCEYTIFDGSVFVEINQVITTDSILNKEYAFEKLTIIPLTNFKWS